MKKTLPFALIIFVVCIMTAGCVQSKLPQPTQVNQTPVPLNGLLNVSIGIYDANVTVFIDDTWVGDILPGKQFSTSVKEGHHTVKVCSGMVCEQGPVEINFTIKTTVDFGERLIKNSPQGRLIVSIGDLIAKVPVFIDNTLAGEISPQNPLNISVRAGPHSVKIISNNVSEEQAVEIISGKQTVVDFGERLTNATLIGPLTVSIGGYNADHLPVYIDDLSVGEVSQNKPFRVMLNEGSHTVRICVAQICENETVNIKFAKETVVVFEEQLKRDREFTKPTVRIVNFILNVNQYTLNLEYINPTTNDTIITTTIGCAYSYIDSATKERKNNFGLTQQKMLVKAGNRETHEATLYLSGGSNIITSDPSIVDVSTS